MRHKQINQSVSAIVNYFPSNEILIAKIAEGDIDLAHIDMGCKFIVNKCIKFMGVISIAGWSNNK